MKSKGSPLQSPKGQAKNMIQPGLPAENDTSLTDIKGKGKGKGKSLYISKKTYKYPKKNEEGFHGKFAKNGLFYNFPFCCLFWLCPKNEPKTEVKCRVMQVIENMENGEKKEEIDDDDNPNVHDLEYQQLPDGDTRECFMCKQIVDEFFACGECKTAKCLDCHKEPVKVVGCLCCKIDPAAMEARARAEAQEAYDDICSQIEEMFKQLKGEDKPNEEEKTKHFKALFDEFDSDGGGSLQLSELQDFLGIYIGKNFGPSLKKAADKYDEVADEFWAEVMPKLDTSGDGNIDLDEFLASITGIFEQLYQKMSESVKKAFELALEQIDKMDGQ